MVERMPSSVVGLGLYISLIIGITLIIVGRKRPILMSLGVAFFGLSIVFLAMVFYPGWQMDPLGYAMVIMGIGAIVMGLYDVIRRIGRET